MPYAWDPTLDDDGPDEDDFLHQIDAVEKNPSVFNHRSILNVGVLVILLVGLLSLFIAYPVVTYIDDNAHALFIEETGGSTFDVGTNSSTNFV